LIKRGKLPPPIRIGRKQFRLEGKFMRWLDDGGAVSIQGSRPATLRYAADQPAKIAQRPSVAIE
jgi:hypothetical protein